MTEKELKKLNRRQLLELLLRQTQRADQLQEQLDKVKSELKDRQTLEDEAGNLQKAAETLNDVVEATMAALDGVKTLKHNAPAPEKEQKIEAIPKAAHISHSIAKEWCKEREIENKKRAEDILAQIEAVKNGTRK